MYSTADNDPVQDYMARFTVMVLQHKHCLMYTRTSIRYGCYCGVAANECRKQGGQPEDCLDECCKHHKECFDRLPRNCSGLEDFDWEWDKEKKEAWIINTLFLIASLNKSRSIISGKMLGL